MERRFTKPAPETRRIGPGLAGIAVLSWVLAGFGPTPLQGESRVPDRESTQSATAARAVAGPSIDFARFVVRGLHRELASEKREELFIAFAQRSPEHLAYLWRQIGHEVPPRAREIAAPRLEQLALHRVSRLSLDEQLGLLLGQGTGSASSGKARKARTAALRGLSKDPALRENFARIEDSWLADFSSRRPSPGPLYATATGFVELKVLIARNLFFSHQRVTRESVGAELELLLRLRDRYGDAQIFAGREVVFVASSQRAPKSDHAVFGSRRVIRRLDATAAALSAYGGAASDRTPVRQVLSEVGERERLTFLFSGHGRSKALKYKGGISVRELADSLSRLRAQGATGSQPPIVVVLSCYGHDFARNLLDRLDRLDPSVPKPILVTAEEFGQPWVKSVYGDELASVLSRGSGESVLLGELGRAWGAGATVLVPDDSNTPRQIF